MRNLAVAIAVGALALIPARINAQVQQVYELVSGNRNVAVFINLSSIRRGAASITAWEVQVLRVGNELGVDYYVSQLRFDCQAETIANLHTVGYNSRGDAIVSGGSQRPTPQVPGSIGSDTLVRVCTQPSTLRDGARVALSPRQALDVGRAVLAE